MRSNFLIRRFSISRRIRGNQIQAHESAAGKPRRSDANLRHPAPQNQRDRVQTDCLHRGQPCGQKLHVLPRVYHGSNAEEM